jgi:hypothetical protein
MSEPEPLRSRRPVGTINDPLTRSDRSLIARRLGQRHPAIRSCSDVRSMAMMRTRRDLTGTPPARRHRASRRFIASGTFALILGSAVLGGCAATDSESHSTAPASSPGAPRPSVVVYRTPTCGCCKSYEDYLRKHGYTFRSEVLDDLEPIRSENHVPSAAASCHTVLIDGYAVEGHVPIEAIDKMLNERPAIDGIGIPGMPTNAPGMGEPDGKPIEVVSFDDGNVDRFTTL